MNGAQQTKLFAKRPLPPIAKNVYNKTDHDHWRDK